jgi:hypothetical protein
MRALLIILSAVSASAVLAGDEWQSPRLIPDSSLHSLDPPYRLTGIERRDDACSAWVVADESVVHQKRTVNVVIQGVLAGVARKLPEGCGKVQIHFYSAVHQEPRDPSFRITEGLGTYDRATNKTTFTGDDRHYGSWVAGPRLPPAAPPQQTDGMPWATNAPRDEGYSIDLVSVDPAPGTPLKAGSAVDFKVAVSYSLDVAKAGWIYLVFQVDETGLINRDKSQVRQEVTDASGTTTLADTVTIPEGAGQLWLYVPLVPEGMRNTKGQIIVRYPITE